MEAAIVNNAQRSRLVLTLVLVSQWAIPAATTQATGVDLEELALAIDAPQVGARAKISRRLSLGRGAITVSSTTPVYTLLAQGKPCGVWVAGPATFRYLVDDPYSLPVAERNLRRESNLKVQKARGKLEIVEELKSAVVWSWDLEVSAAGQTGTAPPFSPWAAELLEDPLFYPPSHDLIAARGLQAPGTIVAFLEGKHHDLQVNVDPITDRVEYLQRFVQLSARYDDFKGRAVLLELVAQPLGRKWWQGFVAPLVAEHEVIELTNDSAEHVLVKTRLTLRATQPAVGLWRSDLTSETIDNHGRVFPVRVKSVTVNGQPAYYIHDASELLIALQPPLKRGATAEVEVAHEGQFAIRPEQRSYWRLGPWAWCPRPPLNGELARMELTVRVPKPFVPFASGQEISRDEAAGMNVVKTRLDKPTQLPAVAAGKYHLHSDEREGKKCQVAAYLSGQKSASERLMKNFFAASEYFESIFGSPYPYPELDIVEISSWGWGQAPAGIIFITSEAYNPLGMSIDGFGSRGINARFMHEVAHGWWGHVIKIGSWEEQWLEESFAEYAAALGLLAMRGGGKAGEREFKQMLGEWKAQTAQIGEGGSIFLANHLAFEDQKDTRMRYNLLYGKGPLVLHALRQELGRELGSKEKGDRYFLALWRSMIKNFPYRWGETRHLVGILNQMTGKDWQPWFDRYVYGTETPAVDLK